MYAFSFTELRDGGVWLARLNNRTLNGLESKEIYSIGLSLQIHITNKCSQICTHCYLNIKKNQTYDFITLTNLKNIIDQIEKINFTVQGRSTVGITGGDPLLHPNFWDFLEYVNKKKTIDIIIMGNPNLITEKVAKALSRFRIYAYQISIDGLEDMHDRIRGKGNFSKSLASLELLNNHDIYTAVLYTVGKNNLNDVVPLYVFLSHLETINIFDINRMVPVGNAEDNNLELLSDKEFKQILYELFIKEIMLKYKLKIGRKDNLWKLLYKELGLLNLDIIDKNNISNGCCPGINCLIINSDGSIVTCPKIKEKIGNIKKDSLLSVYSKSDIIKDFFTISNHKGCFGCSLISYCRGCLAMKKEINGSYFAKDPYCWRD